MSRLLSTKRTLSSPGCSLYQTRHELQQYGQTLWNRHSISLRIISTSKSHTQFPSNGIFCCSIPVDFDLIFYVMAPGNRMFVWFITLSAINDDVMMWTWCFPYYWPFVRGIHRSTVDSLYKRSAMRSFNIFCCFLSNICSIYSLVAGYLGRLSVDVMSVLWLIFVIIRRKSSNNDTFP